MSTEFFWTVFSPNAGKYGPEKLRKRTIFTQCNAILFSEKKLNNLSLYRLPCSFPIFSPSKEMTKLWVGVFVQTTLCCYTEVAPGVVAATETQLSDGTTAWFETLKVKQKNDIICLKMLLCKILIYNLKLKQMVKLVETLTSSGFSAVIRAAITWPFGFIDS